MEKIVQLIDDGILLKILWKQEPERSDKRTVKEELLKSHVGKLCIEYRCTKDEVTATTLTTILPEYFNIDDIKAAFISYYNNKKYKIETRENNINFLLSSSKSENGSASLTISIQLFLEKRKIVVQGDPKQLLDFIKSYYDILASINPTNDEQGDNSNLAEKIFSACNVSNINLDFPCKTTSDPHKHVEMSISTITQDTQRPPNENNVDNINWQQRIFHMFTDLQQSIKDIQLKVDSFTPSIEKIDNISAEIKKCQIRCFSIEEKHEELSKNIDQLAQNQSKFQHSITSLESKIKDTKYEYEEFQHRTNDFIQKSRNELEDHISKLEYRITTNITNEVERAFSFANSISESHDTFKICHKSFAPETVNLPPPQQPSYASAATPSKPATSKATSALDNQSASKASPLLPKSVPTVQSQQSKIPLKEPNIVKSNQVPPEKKYFPQEYVLIGDSNIRYISPTKFPTPIAKIRCPTLQKLSEVLKNTEIPNAKKILLHLGTNDIEITTPDEFSHFISSALITITSRFPDAEVTISSILPRSDDQQRKVIMANDIISKLINELPWADHIQTMHHPYINPRMLSDDKHLDRVGLKTFISEIKFLFFGHARQREFTSW